MTQLAPLSFIHNIVQVGIVVRDLDKALKGYADKLGIGPWRVTTYSAPRLTDTKVRGKPVSYSMRIALAWTGEMNWEIIQPLDGPSIYWEFLEAHGEGLHHIMVDYGDLSLEEVTAQFESHGWGPIMEGSFMGNRYAYYGTEQDLTTLIEVRSAPADWQRPDPDLWYPSRPSESTHQTVSPQPSKSMGE